MQAKSPGMTFMCNLSVMLEIIIHFFHSSKATGIKNIGIQLDYFGQLIIKIVQLEEQFLDNSQESKFPIYALIPDQKSMGTLVAY